MTSLTNCERETNRRLVKLSLLAGAIIVLLWKASWLGGSAAAPVDDFVEYWAASRLLLSGENPYSTGALALVQRPLTGSDKPLIMWNPPWTLSLLFPFGLLEYSGGRWLWLVLNLALLFFSVRWLSCRNLQFQSRGWWATLANLGIAITFLPGAVSLGLGQISPMILAGLVGFVSLLDRKQYFLAGAMTLLISLKPHLLFLFWIVLLLWVWRTRTWSLIAGAGSALIFGVGFPLICNGDLISGYLSLVANEPIFHHPSTTTGAFLRAMLGWEKVWLQMLPMVPGTLWAALYWRQHRRNWDWADRMPLLVLVSVVTTCYGWVFDQTVLYPALFQAAGWLVRVGRQHERLVAAVCYLLTNIAGVALIAMGLNGVAYVWMAPVWLVFHSVAARLWARRMIGMQQAAG